MTNQILLSELEYKLMLSDQVRGSLAAMDDKGVLLTIIKETLMPEIKQDIIKLYNTNNPTDITNFFNKHRNIVRFLSNKKNDHDHEFKPLDIEYYQTLYARQELSQKIDLFRFELGQQRQRDLISEKENGLINLKRYIADLGTNNTYRFKQVEGKDCFELEIIGSLEGASELQLPNSYAHEMDKRLAGKNWLNTHLSSPEAVLYFLKLKEKHFEDMIKIHPQMIAQSEALIAKEVRQLNVLGGSLSKSEINELELFLRGSIATIYNPSTYLSCFDKWQRAEFIRQMKQY